jgi:hypothetical protein
MKAGITGHQNLSVAESDWLKEELEIEIKQIKIEEAYSCLAIGADQLFANVILANKIPLVAITPCKKYEQTFDEKNIELYKSLVKQAVNKIQLDFESPSEEAFYEAGKTVVNKSDVVFAFWNNLPAKGLGGTADIVEYAKSKSKKIILLNPITKTKNYINNGK